MRLPLDKNEGGVKAKNILSGRAGGPLKPGFGLSGDVQISSGDFSFLSDRLILGFHRFHEISR
jgi:hypothetical protein